MFYNLGARTIAAHCCCSCNVVFRRLLVREPSFRRGGIACQCSPLRRKFMDRSIISPALSLLMKHLVIGQRQKAPNFSAFHWSPHGSLVSFGQQCNLERSIFTEKDQNKLNYRSGPNHRIGPDCAGRAQLQ